MRRCFHALAGREGFTKAQSELGLLSQEDFIAQGQAAKTELLARQIEALERIATGIGEAEPIVARVHAPATTSAPPRQSEHGMLVNSSWRRTMIWTPIDQIGVVSTQTKERQALVAVRLK